MGKVNWDSYSVTEKLLTNKGMTFQEEQKRNLEILRKARPDLEEQAPGLFDLVPQAPQTGVQQPPTPYARQGGQSSFAQPRPDSVSPQAGQPGPLVAPSRPAAGPEQAHLPAQGVAPGVGTAPIAPMPGTAPVRGTTPSQPQAQEMPQAPGEVVNTAFENLARGAKGGRVTTLQENLIDLGYDVGGVDGIFGGGVQRGLKKFQKDFGLPEIGIYDRAAAEAMAGAPEVIGQQQDPRGEANEYTRGYGGGKSSNVDALIDSVFVGEGGYSTDRGDTGNYYKGSFVGTNHGISAPVLATYLGRKPTVEDMKKLTKADAAAIYKKNYVTNFGIDLLPADLQEIVFHSVVNSGTHGLKVVQGLIGVPQTGRVDPATKEGMRKATFTKTQFKDALLTKYSGFGTWDKHGTGWTNRFTHLAEGTYLTEEPKGGGPRFIAGTDQWPVEEGSDDGSSQMQMVAEEDNSTLSSHSVQAGDNLSDIAASNGLTLQGLLDLNPQITNPNSISIGQEIMLSTEAPEGGEGEGGGGGGKVKLPKAKQLGMIGGVRDANRVWQSFGSSGMAHSSDYRDYSQLFREYTTTKKKGYYEVGKTADGQTVYAAPDYHKDKDGNYLGVSKDDAVRLAEEYGSLIPQRDWVKRLYGGALRLRMPTQPIYKTGGEGDSTKYTAAINAAIKKNKKYKKGALIVHGKEFFVSR